VYSNFSTSLSSPRTPPKESVRETARQKNNITQLNKYACTDLWRFSAPTRGFSRLTRRLALRRLHAADSHIIIIKFSIINTIFYFVLRAHCREDVFNIFYCHHRYYYYYYYYGCWCCCVCVCVIKVNSNFTLQNCGGGL